MKKTKINYLASFISANLILFVLVICLNAILTPFFKAGAEGEALSESYRQETVDTAVLFVVSPNADSGEDPLFLLLKSDRQRQMFKVLFLSPQTFLNTETLKDAYLEYGAPGAAAGLTAAGIAPDKYIDLAEKHFVEAFNYMGGVELEFAADIKNSGEKVVFKKGPAFLDGDSFVELLRARFFLEGESFKNNLLSTAASAALNENLTKGFFLKYGGFMDLLLDRSKSTDLTAFERQDIDAFFKVLCEKSEAKAEPVSTVGSSDDGKFHFSTESKALLKALFPVDKTG